MKRILTSLICVLTAVCLILGCSFNVLADDGWGTEEEGIHAPHNNYVRYYKAYTETDGCPNADFSQGYRYWTTDYNNKDTKSNQVVEASRIEKDGDNTYVVMTPHFQYDNIATVMFTDSRVQVDDKLVVLYDWHNTSGDASIQVIIYQYILDSNGKCVASHRISDASDGGITDLTIAFNDTDWNTSMSRQRQQVKDPTQDGGDGKIYLSFVIESITEFTDHGTKVDNLRLAKYNKESGDVFDLDGKRLYNVNELNEGTDIEDEIQTDAFDNIDYDAENEELAEKSEEPEKKESFIAKYLVWIIVGAGVLLLIIAGVVVAIIIVVAKKKKKATDEETTVDEIEEDSQE